MDFHNRLASLNHPAKVEVVYLCGRYLSHGLDEAGFRSQLDVDVMTRYKDQSAAVVLEIMSDIEAKEGKPIADLAPRLRWDYADEIGEAAWGDEDYQVDEDEADQASPSMSGP